METETQIAEENIKKIIAFNEAYKDWNNKKLSDEVREEAQKFVDGSCDNDTDGDTVTLLSEEHKASCQRTMQKWINLFNLLKDKGELKTWVRAFIDIEIDDNLQAIKLYEDARI